MTLLQKLKYNILNILISLIPKSSYQNLINHLIFNFPEYKNPKEFALLNYDKHRIYISKGLREDYAQKEPDTIKWIENYIKPNQVFYDIGANIGGFSLIASKFHAGLVKVYAFEPSFDNFPHLTRNIIKNDCTNSVFPLNFPLSKSLSVDKFNYSILQEGGSCHSFGKPLDQDGKIFQPKFSHLTISISIDDLVQKFNFPVPNHIKLDVDGIEYEILLGAKSVLENRLLQTIIVEITENSNSFYQINELLKGCGFIQIEKYCASENVFNYLYVKQSK